MSSNTKAPYTPLPKEEPEFQIVNSQELENVLPDLMYPLPVYASYDADACYPYPGDC